MPLIHIIDQGICNLGSSIWDLSLKSHLIKGQVTQREHGKKK